MESLDNMDLYWAVRRLPKRLKDVMTAGTFGGKIFVGGGYLRAVVSGEEINDVDIFVESKEMAEALIKLLKKDDEKVFSSENAFTLPGKMAIQIIHRWTFTTKEQLCHSFDFTICQAAIEYSCLEKKWSSYCHERFYVDLASKRLVYTSPVREEEAGGSMLRVLKYYQKGYRIPIDSLGDVMARVFAKVRESDCCPEDYGKVITGLLREVDPNVDPFHICHLPAQTENINQEKEI